MLGYSKQQWAGFVRSKQMIWVGAVIFCLCGWTGIVASSDTPPAQLPAKFERAPAVVSSHAPDPLPTLTPTSGPTPKKSTSTTKPPPPRTTTTRALPVVHAGSFCSPRGARGVTSAGTLMVCKPSDKDTRNRWRAA